MKLGGRVTAAIEILEAFQSTRKKSLVDIIRDWGRSNRFAGSTDRAVIGNLVYDALRQRASNAFLMDSDTAHAGIFATLMRQWNFSFDTLQNQFADDRFSPALPETAMMRHFKSARLDTAKSHIQADCPAWIVPSLEANFGTDWLVETQAMTKRAPLDIRVSTGKISRQAALAELQSLGALACNISPDGIRIRQNNAFQRLPNLTGHPLYTSGAIEIQDEGSQIAAMMTGARPTEQILDYCAGAGGKSLALASHMGEQGQIYAYDVNHERMKPVYDRSARAGVNNLRILTELGELAPLVGNMDRVLVDAPCSGSGTWRRHPESKWSFDAAILSERLEQQQTALATAAEFVRPGGFLVYVTCSILPEENETQLYNFLDDQPRFELVSLGEVWQDRFGFDKPQPWSADLYSITLTPQATDTDGFFVAAMVRLH